MSEHIPLVEPCSTSIAIYESALKRLRDVLTERQREYQQQKQRADLLGKELSALRIKPGQILEINDLPITLDTIAKAATALKDGGTNVKGFQKALGIFDVAELNRARKALVIASVTTETENHMNSNSTWIELHPDFASDTGEEEEPESQQEPALGAAEPSASAPTQPETVKVGATSK